MSENVFDKQGSSSYIVEGPRGQPGEIGERRVQVGEAGVKPNRVFLVTLVPFDLRTNAVIPNGRVETCLVIVQDLGDLEAVVRGRLTRSFDHYKIESIREAADDATFTLDVASAKSLPCGTAFLCDTPKT